MRINQYIRSRAAGIRRILLVILAASLVLSAVLAAGRHQGEMEHRQVEVAVEYSEVVRTATENGLTLREVLQVYQEAGATSLFVKELSFSDYENDIWFRTGGELQAQGLPGRDSWIYIVTGNQTVAENLIFNLDIRGYLEDSFQQEEYTYIGTSLPLNNLWNLPPDRIAQINNIGLGWPEEDMHLAQEMGFLLQLQIKDWQPLEEEDVAPYFAQFRQFPAVSLVLFNSSDLFGFDRTSQEYVGNMALVAEEIRSLGVPVAQVEFFAQKGFNHMAQLMEEQVVRMHTISAAEQRIMSPGQSVERMTLAAKDRNMRALLLRQIYLGDMDDLEVNARYLSGVRSGLERAGLSAGQVQVLPEVRVDNWQLMVLVAGVLAGAFLLALRLNLGLLGLLGAAAGLAGAAGLVFLGQTVLVQKVFALGAVCVFPVLSIDGILKETPMDKKETVISFLKMTLISLAGALLMVGLLADRRFMLTLEVFTGVKLAHVLPLAVVVILYFLRRSREELLRMARAFLDTPLTVKLLVATLMALLILGLYVMRTGNEAGAVSTLELTFRNLLERLTGARPRTKEFLIGHPAMLLLLFLGLRVRTLPLLVLGTIGQVSVVNTYAHIHTPLMISLLRSVLGAAAGLVAGLVLIFVWERFFRWIRRQIHV